MIRSLVKAAGYSTKAPDGREAFDRRDKSTPWDGKGTQWMEHHLYVCNKDSKELARHLAFRDYLVIQKQLLNMIVLKRLYQ